MAASPVLAKVTFDEYLERERAANFKSEDQSGEIFAMAGGDIYAGIDMAHE